MLKGMAAFAEISQTDPASEFLADLQKKLLADHAVGMRTLQVLQSSCCSLQAAGCFQAGLLTQVSVKRLLAHPRKLFVWCRLW